MAEKIIYYLLTFALMLLGSFIWKLLKKRAHHKRLMTLRDTIENVYLVSKSLDGYEPNVGRAKEFCTFVAQPEMHDNYLLTMELLKESGNRFVNGENVSPELRTKVLCFYFGDGENVNETFEEYGNRVELEVLADRAQRHKLLKDKNPDWYVFAQHGQNVIEWVRS